MPVSQIPTFKAGGLKPIPSTGIGNVLTDNGPNTQPTFQAPAPSGGVGASVNFVSPSGTIDPSIVGFTAGVGSAGTGRIKVTLSANTTWEGLPTGADGQQLFGTIVAGNFFLTLSALNGATAQKQILASRDTTYTLGDTFQAFYDSGLGQWVLVA